MSTDDPDRTVPRDSEPDDATLVKSPEEQARAASAAAPWVAIPGYEIEGELKRGGMGVVYRARQAGLNRTVALKMILAGAFADPATRTRFLFEAESVAALEHPNVVKVFAFGEHAGHPYLAMEFLPGGTLADRVTAGGPLPSREATEHVAKLAEAVAHAHSRGVVHRDIKPANVLLTADGEPRLADFGLAKVGRSDLTGTGQALGTPSYMSPEQAAGKTHEVGTPADVYALGAVFYDLLTGRPPFRGDSVAVTLQQVLTTDPERPRKLVASIPRDLETICLKCLEKAPEKRYPTAQSLADDLHHFLRGEPISVRPSGPLERGYKWVKRNKVVSGALAAVTLALLVGAGVSLGFGLYANEQANEAKQKKEEADDATAREQKEKQDAIDARNELKGKNDELLQSRERLNRTLAKALLGPMTANNRGNSLTAYEAGAFWQIAELRRDVVPLMFLEEAARTPLACEQLECRAEYALHAAVGLDPERHGAVERMLLSRLSKPETQGKHAVSLAVAIASTDFASPEAAAISARVLAADIAEHPSRSRDRAKVLAAIAPWIPSDAAADIFPRAVRALTGTLAIETGYDAVEVAMSLVALASAMSPGEAEAVYAQAASAIGVELAKESDPFWRGLYGRDLATVAYRMKPAEAASVCARAARILIGAIAGTMDTAQQRELLSGLISLAERMEPAAAAQILATELAERKDGNIRGELAIGLASAAGRMKPVEAAKVCAPAARILTNALANERNHSDMDSLARGLSEVAQYLDRPQAIKLLEGELEKDKSPVANYWFARGCAKINGHYELLAGIDQAHVAAVARSEADQVSKARFGYQQRVAAEQLTLAASRLEPTEAFAFSTQAVRALMDGFALEGHDYERRDVAAGIAALALGQTVHTRKRSLHATVLAIGTFATPHNVLPSIPLLHPHFHPQPRPLPPQTLVELLKHPFCVGEARRAVLDALAFTYNRPFKDQWEFVEYAQKHQPQLDLLTPPKRPERP